MIDLLNNKLIFENGMAEVAFLAPGDIEEDKKDMDIDTPKS